MPWNEYGEVRGLNAPPRMMRAPAAATIGAMASTCAFDSIVHGPAISTTSRPPTFTPFPTSTIVSSSLNWRDASLNGDEIRTTFATPSSTSN